MKNVFDKIKIVLTTLDVDMPKSFGFVLDKCNTSHLEFFELINDQGFGID